MFSFISFFPQTIVYLKLCHSRWSTVTSNPASVSRGGPAATGSVAGSTGSASGGANNNQPTGFSRAVQRAVHVSRGGRRSNVIVGGRPLVPASVVPEDLISQVSGVALEC